MSKSHDICVIGLGYIGLPTASIFATRGKQVLGVDVVPEVVATINEGRIHIEEPDLDIMVRAAVQSGNLRAATEPERADTFIIAVPTPSAFDDSGARIPDLSYIEKASYALAPVVEDGNLVILESTSPVGTTELVRDWLAKALEENGRDLSVDRLHFAHCPERVLPGQMLKELVSNDRIAGGLTAAAAEKAKALYESFCTAEIFVTDARTAEMAKLTENASRDVSIAFANELSMVCDRLEIDVWKVIELANRHPRVNILNPGPGVGGHCIAVDPWFIVASAPEEARLMRLAREVNDAKPDHVFRQVLKRASRFKDPVIACFGLAFKADVDDLRESPALEIVERLVHAETGRLLVVEPHCRKLPARLEGKALLVDAAKAVNDADILVMLVDHREFRNVERRKLQEKVVIDTRGSWR